MNSLHPTTETLGALLFGLAVVHTFAASKLQQLGNRFEEGSVAENLFHLLGEVEVVFGLWAGILFLAHGGVEGFQTALAWTEKLQFTEPLFVLAIMTVAATQPVLQLAEKLIQAPTRIPGIPRRLREPLHCFLLLTVGPLLGSLITEPAAMTVTALLLRDRYLRTPPAGTPRNGWFLHALVAVLFVNVSIGGVLTPYAAPPVLMVASKWNWGLSHMLTAFGWKALIAVILNSLLFVSVFRAELHPSPAQGGASPLKMTPAWLSAVHLLALAGIVVSAHHPVVFTAIFLYFLGVAAITQEYQSELRLRESLLVAFFLGGLVYLSSFQAWWLKPILEALSEKTLFFGATGLTAITDNAAITTLGALSPTLTEGAKFALVAGAVTGGGLTLIANAPNPAGYAILKDSFGEDGLNAGRLFLGALLPTLIAGACLLLL